MTKQEALKLIDAHRYYDGSVNAETLAIAFSNFDEDKEREAFYEWEGQNDVTPLAAWLERASRGDQ